MPIFLVTDRTVGGATIRIVAHGDSQTWSTIATQVVVTVVASVLSGKGITADYRCVGIGGAGYGYAYPSEPQPQTLVQDAPAWVDRYLSGTLTNYLIAWGGTNDIHLNSSSGATTYAAFQTYIADRLAAGWPAANICVCTMLPRQNTKETQRGDYNTLLVAGASTYGYKLARFDQDATMGAAGSELNGTYYADQIHPTTAGNLILSNLVYAALFP